MATVPLKRSRNDVQDSLEQRSLKRAKIDADIQIDAVVAFQTEHPTVQNSTHMPDILLSIQSREDLSMEVVTSFYSNLPQERLLKRKLHFGPLLCWVTWKL